MPWKRGSLKIIYSSSYDEFSFFIFTFDDMRILLFVCAFLCGLLSADAQITITASDMPVAGDTLRYSIATLPDSVINPGDSGANVAWNYPLTMAGQAVDSYLTALQVNPLYFLTVGATAAGYKVADSLPLGGVLPISIQQVYTFFEEKNSPSRYVANAFAASISGIPTAINYSEPDVWYVFPLTYMSQDSNNFKLTITVPTLGAIKESGYRKTRVDGWGTITTPYYTTPVSCIRVRSEIHQVDSIPLGPLSIGFPLNTVEYKWLVNGDHYPALWVTSNLLPGGAGETITNVRYRDMWRDTATVSRVNTTPGTFTSVRAYPNPAIGGTITLELTADWQNFTVIIRNLESKVVGSFRNQKVLDLSGLPPGNYVGQVASGTMTAYFKITR